MQTTMPHSRPFDPGAATVDTSDKADVFAELDATAQRQDAEKANHGTLASMLAGARSLTPILEAVVFSPGVDAPHDDMQHAVETMLQASNTITERAMQTLAIDDTDNNSWAKSMLHQLAVGGVAEQWKHTGRANPSTWLAIIDSVITAGVTERRKAYADVTDQTAYQTSHFAALSTIASEVRRYNFYINNSALLEHLSLLLDQHVSKATPYVLEGVEAAPADHLMVEQGMLKHASRLFSEIYRSEAENTDLEVSRMSESERRQFLETGQPQERIKRINTSFSNLFSTLTRTSRQRAAASVQRRPAPTPSLS